MFVVYTVCAMGQKEQTRTGLCSFPTDKTALHFVLLCKCLIPKRCGAGANGVRGTCPNHLAGRGFTEARRQIQSSTHHSHIKETPT